MWLPRKVDIRTSPTLVKVPVQLEVSDQLTRKKMQPETSVLIVVVSNMGMEDQKKEPSLAKLMEELVINVARGTTYRVSANPSLKQLLLRTISLMYNPMNL